MSNILNSPNPTSAEKPCMIHYRVCLRIERDTCFMTYTADPSHFLIQLLPSNDNPRYGLCKEGVAELRLR